MTFDPNTFLDTAYTQAMSTQHPKCPPGIYPRAQISDATPRIVPTDNGPRGILEVHYRIDGWQGPPVRQTIWLDTNPDGSLDNSQFKNVELGLLRTALGQNQQGVKWTPRMLIGQVVQVKVEDDQRNPRFSRVTAVAPVGAVAPGQAGAAPATLTPTMQPPAAPPAAGYGGLPANSGGQQQQPQYVGPPATPGTQGNPFGNWS